MSIDFCMLLFVSRTLDRSGAGNQTSITEVILEGLTSHRSTQMALFAVFLIAYLFTMVGNLIIIMLIRSDSRLHTPMYFFLSNLSGLEMWFVSTNLPQMLAHLLAGGGRLPLYRCVAQMYFSCSLGVTEAVLLGAMAYDRYVAICSPLVYVVVMSKRRCWILAAISWMLGFLFPLVVTSWFLHLPFCGRSHIDHFFCSLQMVSKLVCGEVRAFHAMILVMGASFTLAPLCVILISYCLILRSVVHMSSGSGWRKAFSTCASHLAVVTMYYGTVMALYLRPRSGTDSSHDKHVSVFHVVITPLLNPVIYTLRNKDIHAAASKMLDRGCAGLKD